MFCSWYDGVDIVLSMIDTEYLRLSQMCFHGNCCRLSTDNLQRNVVIRQTDRVITMHADRARQASYVPHAIGIQFYQFI